MANFVIGCMHLVCMVLFAMVGTANYVGGRRKLAIVNAATAAIWLASAVLQFHTHVLKVEAARVQAQTERLQAERAP